MNPINRGVDTGWVPTRGQNNEWTGAIQAVPESLTFGEVGTPANTLFGFLTARGGQVGSSYLKTYNAFIAEQDSVVERYSHATTCQRVSHIHCVAKHDETWLAVGGRW